jgi:hypothetical protein
MVRTDKLTKAQQTLWDLLTANEKEQHLRSYKAAKANLENGINETIIDYCRVENNAPAALFFPLDDSLTTQPNIVGEVKRRCDSLDTVVVFQSEDIIALLELYYGNNILNI